MNALLIAYTAGLLVTITMALWVHHLEGGPIEFHHLMVILLWPIALPGTLFVTALDLCLHGSEGDE